MGTCFNLRSDLTWINMPAARVPEALAAVKAVGEMLQIERVINATDLTEAMAHWRWKPCFDAEGNLSGMDADFFKWYGQSWPIDAIAPFVERGTIVVEWEGSTQEEWHFRNGGVEKRSYEVRWYLNLFLVAA
jgi:hypothetical protein